MMGFWKYSDNMFKLHYYHLCIFIPTVLGPESQNLVLKIWIIFSFWYSYTCKWTLIISIKIFLNVFPWQLKYILLKSASSGGYNCFFSCLDLRICLAVLIYCSLLNWITGMLFRINYTSMYFRNVSYVNGMLH